MKLELATKPEASSIASPIETVANCNSPNLETLRTNHSATAAEFAAVALLLVKHTNSPLVKIRRFFNRNPDVKSGEKSITARQVKLNQRLANLAAQSHDQFIRINEFYKQESTDNPDVTY